METDETENGNGKLKRKTEMESGNGKAEIRKWSPIGLLYYHFHNIINTSVVMMCLLPRSRDGKLKHIFLSEFSKRHLGNTSGDLYIMTDLYAQENLKQGKFHDLKFL